MILTSNPLLMVESTPRPIIIDNGSGMIKAGFGGDEKPFANFHCIVGTPKNASYFFGSSNPQELFIGDEVQKLSGVLNITYPIEHGIVKSWEHMTKIWEHTIFNELRVDPKETQLMLTEAPMNPKNNRESMIDIAFNTFGVKGFYVGIQAVLAMFSTGRTTGIVVDSGDGVTHTVPIFETYSVPHAVKKAMFAGRDISKGLDKILTERGWTFETSAGFQIVRNIKEKMCYVSMDYKKEMEESFTKEWKDKFEKAYRLPDGNELLIGNERFRAPEIMFQPTLVGKDVPGVHRLAFNSIMECDLDVRKSLWENVILSGGSTMFENYPERLQTELMALAPKNINVKVVATPDRKYSVFIGASELSTLSSFADAWITKAEYDENGCAIVHRKCF